MEYSARLNGFIGKGYSVKETLEAMSQIEGLDYVDLNYPEHFQEMSLQELKDTLNRCNLKVNSLAARFRGGFENGEFSNSDDEISKKAIDIAKEASDISKEMECNHVILWFGNDGFTYSFEVDYTKIWLKSRNAIREVCDYNKDVMITIEYKPYEPRSFSMFPSVGITALMIKDVDRANIKVTIDLAHVYMKGEMPAYSLSLLNHFNILSGVHLNDGYGLMDDGLLVGSVRFIQTLEFFYYLKRDGFDKAIYFDTFPIRENPVEEVEQNIRMSNKMIELIDSIGMDKIQQIIESNDGIKAQEIMMMCLK